MKPPTASEVTFGKEDFEKLRSHLLAPDGLEHAAILTCGISRTTHKTRLLVREVVPVPPEGFRVQEELRLSISPTFIAPVLKRCRLKRWAFVLCHSHPFSERTVEYSWVDDDGEATLFGSVHSRAPGLPHGSLLFGQTSVRGRLWSAEGRHVPIDAIRVLGPTLREFVEASADPFVVPAAQARQALLFGREGQRTIASSRVAVVGTGGTGSIVFEMLVRIGVRDITLIDPDKVEESNLSRLLGATPSDVGRPKVDVLKGWGEKVQPGVAIVAIKGSVTDEKTVLLLRDMDFVFCCTDTHWSRAVLNQFAYQYLVPVVDMGIQFEVDPSGALHGGGKVVRLGPGFPCAWCYGFLDPGRVAEESMEPQQRETLAKEGYVRGVDAPAPTVISFNGAVASAAVSDFLAYATGYAGDAGPAPRRNFDLLTGTVRRATALPKDECVCSETGAKALGDSEPLPAKRW